MVHDLRTARRLEDAHIAAHIRKLEATGPTSKPKIPSWVPMNPAAIRAYVNSRPWPRKDVFAEGAQDAEASKKGNGKSRQKGTSSS